MIASKGILTSHGGATSHAAVVARQFGTPAVCGADVLTIDVEHRIFSVQKESLIEVREGTGSASTAAPARSSWENLKPRIRISNGRLI